MFTSMKTFLTLIFFIFLTVSSFAQGEGALRIKVEGIHKMEGAVAVALYDIPKDYMKNDFRNIHQKISEGDIFVIFDKLPAGNYAISLFHDENSNKELDTNLIGLPTEAYGFGNDARGMFGPPSFSAASVKVSSGQLTDVVIFVK